MWLGRAGEPGGGYRELSQHVYVHVHQLNMEGLIIDHYRLDVHYSVLKELNMEGFIIDHYRLHVQDTVHHNINMEELINRAL